MTSAMQGSKPEDVQSWNPRRYDTNARFVSDLGAPVLELLAPRSGERILDLGCGDGVLTKKLQDAGVDVVGADASPSFVDACRELGLTVYLVDGHDLRFDGEFDAVFSNAALHWMTRPDAVLKGVRRALKPGGRFVAEFGGYLNVATVRTALYAVLDRYGIDAAAHDPWYFPSPEAYRRRLEAHDFTVESIELIPRPTRLPGELGGWLETFAESFLKALAPAERPAAMDAIAALTRPMLQDETGVWTVDYCRLRFRAHLAE